LPIIRAIAARIRAERLAAGLSQEEASARASIGYKRWQDIEGARVNLTIRTLVRIATALEVEFWEIVRPERPTRARKRSLRSVGEEPGRR
jgi:transcriptional regulator with XRE-family HTH domain